MSEQKYYSITDIVKKYDTTRATMYYRFSLLSDYVHLIDDIKVIDEKGLSILIEELDLKERSVLEEMEEEQSKKQQEPRIENSGDGVGFQTEIILEHIKLKDKELELKEREIERLHDVINNLNNNLDKALELNQNNQVLLLEKNKQLNSINNIKEDIIEMKQSREEKSVERIESVDESFESEAVSEEAKGSIKESINIEETKKGFWSKLFNRD